MKITKAQLKKIIQEELASVLSEAKPEYKGSKPAEDRLDKGDPPAEEKPAKPEKTALQKARDRVKRAKDNLAKDPQNAGLKKRLTRAKEALEKAHRTARGL